MFMEKVSRTHPLSKPELHGRLKQWLRDNNDKRVGDPDVVGVAAWIHVRDGQMIYRLHADASREAVSEYLRLVERYGDDLEWTVVPNKRGRNNAVAYGPDRIRLVPFYLYAT
jgi:hypothetical protein